MLEIIIKLIVITSIMYNMAMAINRFDKQKYFIASMHFISALAGGCGMAWLMQLN